MKLGLKLKEARDFREMSQLDLSQKSGVSRASIQLYEADKGNITIANLEKIANALDFGLEYFLDLSPSMSPSQEENVTKSVTKSEFDVLLSQTSPQNLSISQRKSVHKLSISESLSQTSPQNDSETNCRSLAGVHPKNIAGVHSSPQDLSINHQKVVHQSVHQSSKSCPSICPSPQDLSPSQEKMSLSMSLSQTSPQDKDSLVDSLVSKSEFVSQKDEFVSPTSPLPKASISPLGDIYVSSDHKLYPYIQGEYDVSDLIMLPVFVNGRVSCGSGEPYNEGDVYFLPQSKSFLKTKFNLVSTGALGIIQAIGNSMHPTIDEGDLLLFQCDGSAIDGGIYIIEFEGDYFTKRLIKRPSIKLISDNPIYEPIEIANLQEIKIIGRVVGVISNLRL